MSDIGHIILANAELRTFACRQIRSPTEGVFGLRLDEGYLQGVVEQALRLTVLRSRSLKCAIGHHGPRRYAGLRRFGSDEEERRWPCA
jgi:hypothetical protein